MKIECYSLKVITGPTVYVATPADVHSWGQNTQLAEDDEILETIKSSTAVMESLVDRIFCTQTLEMRIDKWPSDRMIQLAKGPWQSITSVKYYEPVAGVLTTWTSTNYVFEETSGVLMLKDTSYWPQVQIRPGAIQIQYKAGYGDLATDPPTICKRAVILGVLDEMENRHGRFEIPAGVRQKLQAIWPGTH